MPSPMNGSGYNTPDLHKDDLSDEAIELLYTIIQRASSSPDRSSRALFNAYEEVLEEYGLLPSDDAVLHRFLFRMQKDRRREESLVERFHRVLGEFEIVVDEESEGENTRDIDFRLGRDQQDIARTGAYNQTAAHAMLGHAERLTRRGSFESFFDGSADKIAGSEVRDVSRSKRRGSLGHAPHGVLAKRRSTSDTEALRFQQAQLPIRTRVSRQAQRRVSSGQHQGRRRNASISSRASLRIRRDANTLASRQKGYERADSEYTERTTSLDLSRVQVPGVNAPIPNDQYAPGGQHDSTHYYQQFVPEPYHPSDTRLMNEAETFEFQRLHRVTRDCLQTWRNRTRDLLERRYEQEGLAEAFDRRILLKVTLDQLRDTVRLRRSNHETDRFFRRLETRAEKARNLFLLTKAFTHWAKSAEDEVLRTSVARRHMLRTRFFNGWREITAVNELKIQHFVLAKFLQQWRTRTAIVRENAQFAVTLYEENLVQKVFTKWFFQFCSIAGSAWHNDRVKRSTLRRWIEVACANIEKNELAIQNCNNSSMGKIMANWKQRVTAVRTLEAQADEFRQTALITSGLYSLKKHALLAPVLRRVQITANNRRIRAAFLTWRHTAQLSQRARQVDKLRVMRNAYTAWNDRLRMQALEQRIDDRILVECLYRWTLASRVSLFQRVHDKQLKESTFRAWLAKTSQRSNTLDTAEQRFASFKRAQLLRTCLKKMEIDAAERRREECAVIADYDMKLKQRVFERLKERLEHFQQLKQWSDDARFYVLGTRTLKKWNNATQQTRRNRRRDTYAQVRRTVKTNLVRRLFDTWRAKANTIAEQNQEAAVILEDRTLRTAGALLHSWHNRMLSVQQLNNQASDAYAFELGSKHFRIWTQRLGILQSMEAQATALRQESVEIAAAGALKKLGWRLWNVQRQDETAQALFDRNFEKHVRAMLRFWHEQTAERLANRPVSPTPTRSSRGGRRSPDEDHSGFNVQDEDVDHVQERDHDGAGDETRRLEAWTAFDASALGLNNNLDLSLSVTPERQHPTIYPLPSQTSSPKPPPSTRPPTSRPRTFPQLASTLRNQPAPEPASPDLDFPEDERSNFWAGTPAYPPPTTSKPPKGAGYLKTPSKRAIVRAKRPELPASPEKRVTRLGAMSAPPVQTSRDFGVAGGDAAGAVTSFQRRLREGGFGASVEPSAVPNSAMKGSRGRAARGRGRVGFGDVSKGRRPVLSYVDPRIKSHFRRRYLRRRLCTRCAAIDFSTFFASRVATLYLDPPLIWDARISKVAPDEPTEIRRFYFFTPLGIVEQALPSAIAKDGPSYFHLRQSGKMQRQIVSFIFTPVNLVHRSQTTPRSIDWTLVGRWLQADLNREGATSPGEPTAHRSAVQPEISSSSTPSVIVIDCKTRTILEIDHAADYVTLSYVWGPTAPDEAMNYAVGDHLQLLPQTVEDSVLVCLQIGYRYLWVDRYCIPQKNDTERRRQIQAMDAIYANSSLTIVACAGEDPHYGLPGVTKSRRPCPSTYVEKSGYLQMIPMVEDIHKSAWAGRAWTYQETILSRKRLYFTDRQLYFEGSNMVSCEWVTLAGQQTLPDTPWIFAPSTCLGKPSHIYRCLAAFTSRKLSYSSDALNAMLGVFAVYERRFQVRHLWGMPFKHNDQSSDTTPLLLRCSLYFYSDHDPMRWSYADSEGPVHSLCISPELKSGRIVSWNEYQDNYKTWQYNDQLSKFIHVEASLSPVLVIERDDLAPKETEGHFKRLRCRLRNGSTFKFIHPNFLEDEMWQGVHNVNLMWFGDSEPTRRTYYLIIQDKGAYWERIALISGSRILDPKTLTGKVQPIRLG
ncbi:hypothetical protein OPT61_g1337 [Boeremia exigua]|uniref:Uncharacterized protein n=1 Tax=Boeremia exigua TaxID=749465 RepID=A0ACC2IQJ5_9PLEO|nr:hypothetical protein OPT61_g1337 [Boeremia exigua]